MIVETFYEYIANHLLPYLKKEKVKFPVILFVDGHKSHMSLHLSNLCVQEKIILVALSTPIQHDCCNHWMLPSSKKLKSSWKSAVTDWYSRNLDGTLTKKHFEPVLQKALGNVKEEWIKQRFKKTGLYPWNPSAFDESLCLGKRRLSETPETATITYGTFKRLVGDKLSTDPVLQILERAFSSATDVITEDRPPATESDLNEVPEEIVDSPVHGIPKTDNVASSADLDGGNSPLEDVLHWPGTPKRKFKRQVERLTYVLTSKNWKNVYEM